MQADCSASEYVDPLDADDVLRALRGAIKDAQTRRPETNWARVCQVRDWMLLTWRESLYGWEPSSQLITSRLLQLEREGKVEQVALIGKRGHVYNGWQEPGGAEHG